MTLTLELSPDLEIRLVQEAAVQGMPIENYALSVLEQSRPAAFDARSWLPNCKRGSRPVRRNSRTMTCCNNSTRIARRIVGCIRPS